jgi:hypothetical protein
VVCTAIVVERQEDGHSYPVQRPVYFVSEVLSETKAHYQPVQKLVYALLITSRKLRHYFQQYSVSIVTDYPLGDILQNQDATGRISKWAVELGALTINFKPRTAIKSQALVDFKVEWRENQLPTPTVRPEHWVMYFDEGVSEDSRRVDIDSLAEARCAALVQSARYLEGIRRYHDRNVKERSFNVGDLVLRRIQKTEGLHKLSSPWEGPFTVAKVTGPGSYRLQTLEGEDINNSWNIDQLCRFYA